MTIVSINYNSASFREKVAERILAGASPEIAVKEIAAEIQADYAIKSAKNAARNAINAFRIANGELKIIPAEIVEKMRIDYNSHLMNKVPMKSFLALTHYRKGMKTGQFMATEENISKFRELYM